MAQTRATGKACRLAFSWIMSLAGYEPTPAEEMPDKQQSDNDLLISSAQHKMLEARISERIEPRRELKRGAFDVLASIISKGCKSQFSGTAESTAKDGGNKRPSGKPERGSASRGRKRFKWNHNRNR
ncbi:MAG: hypothetical protein IPK63_23660 [Candidatus Competibacteraceae bacterium]|nr:hypothetical protein [Candidatus Competibacteraceae bacterium]